MRSGAIGAVVVLAAAWCAAPMARAQVPALHQVYVAAQAGKFPEAQAMMDNILRDNPNSAKAHFVEAELLAKQGLLARAGAELASAERLSPGLPFARPEALRQLRALTGRAATVAPARSDLSYERVTPAAPPAYYTFGWTAAMILGVGALLAIIMLAYRRMLNRPPAPARRNVQPDNPAGMEGMDAAYPLHAASFDTGPSHAASTGVALGAGIATGAALIRAAPASYDMGGTDFGVSDAGGGGCGD